MVLDARSMGGFLATAENRTLTKKPKTAGKARKK